MHHQSITRRHKSLSHGYRTLCYLGLPKFLHNSFRLMSEDSIVEALDREIMTDAASAVALGAPGNGQVIDSDEDMPPIVPSQHS